MPADRRQCARRHIHLRRLGENGRDPQGRGVRRRPLFQRNPRLAHVGRHARSIGIRLHHDDPAVPPLDSLHSDPAFALPADARLPGHSL